MNQSIPFPKKAKPQVQHQQPGIESVMDPAPIYEHPDYQKEARLQDKVAIITGGDSGIGRAVAVAFAKEGADLAIVYYNETEDAKKTKEQIEKLNRQCLLIQGDLANASFAQDIVNQTLTTFGKINILVNNAAVQYPQADITQIKDEELHRTFDENYFGTFI